MLQVHTPQQPTGLVGGACDDPCSEVGMNVCGIMAAANFRRFLHGVETAATSHVQQRLGHGATVPNVDSWVHRHMGRPLNGYSDVGDSHVMEAMRGSALRYALELIVRAGGDLNVNTVDRLLRTSFQPVYVSAPKSIYVMQLDCMPDTGCCAAS